MIVMFSIVVIVIEPVMPVERTVFKGALPHSGIRDKTRTNAAIHTSSYGSFPGCLVPYTKRIICTTTWIA